MEPPSKKQKLDDCDTFAEDVDVDGSFHMGDKFDNFVRPEELEKLREFQVLDEVKSNDEDSEEESGDDDDAKSEGVPEEEIEKMLDQDLPEDFKAAPKPKEKPYVTRQKTVLEEKGVNQFEVLPLDWMMVRHYSGMPVYMHRGTRVCTLGKPYSLGKGNTRRHDIPISAIPCLAYRRALEEEEKQKEIDAKIKKQIESGSWINKADRISQASQNDDNRSQTSDIASQDRQHDNASQVNEANSIGETEQLSKEISDLKDEILIKEEIKMEIEEMAETMKCPYKRLQANGLADVVVDTKKVENKNSDRREVENEINENDQNKVDVKIAGETNHHDQSKVDNEIARGLNENDQSKVDNEIAEGVNKNESTLENKSVAQSKNCDGYKIGDDEIIENDKNKIDVEIAGETNQHDQSKVDNEIARGLNENDQSKVDNEIAEGVNKNESTLENKSVAPSKNCDGYKIGDDEINENDKNKIDVEIAGEINQHDQSKVDNDIARRLNENDQSTLENKSVTQSENGDEDETPLNQQPVVLPGGIVMPPPRVETVSTSWKTQQLTHDQVNDYCKKLFKFKTVNIMHFRRWADRRKYAMARKTLQYPTLPEGTKLITIPAQPANGQDKGGKASKRDWVMNMNGRSYLSVFHEYVRRALQKQPVYEFKQLENASSPYQATVHIGGMQYGSGRGSSKRQAKSAAARASIYILIPEMRAELDAPAADPDFTFFDYVGIEDPRISEFCTATCEPSPHAILRTCLLRNFGAQDRHIHTEMKKLEYQKIELTMRVGRHSATVVCKNKKAAKQRASQAILQALHPHVRSWGSLLRLYGSRSVKSCKEKKIEEQQITLLQDKARHNEPNYAVLEKLRNEMRKLKERDEAVVPIGTLLVKDDLPTHSGSNLNNVDL